jgi:outer membrane protein TolC
MITLMRGTWITGIFLYMPKRTTDTIQKHSPVCGLLSGLFLLLLGILPFLAGWPAIARSAEDRPQTAPAEVSRGPANFDDCVRLALRQSPFFTKSSLEIEVRRMNAADSRSDFFPSLSFSSRYYIAQPKNPYVDDPSSYVIAFSTGDYNPIVAALSLKVNKVIIKIATLGHLKVIAGGIQRLGKAFLELDAMERLARLQATKVELARENLRYARQRQKLGEITPMEVDIASQEAEVAAAEQETIAASQAKLREGLRSFLALKPDQPLRLDLKDTRRQVLGDFDPAKASREKGEDLSFDLRIKKLTKELQSWNVTLAKMKFLPNVNLAAQTPDPLNQNSNQAGMFFSVGLNFPLFDGFKRVRNITRQQTILKQYASEEQVTTTEFTGKWREAEGEYRQAATVLKVAKAQAELSRLKEQQGETLYRTGEKEFAVFMVARLAQVKADMEAVKTALEADLAALDLRHLSGELVYRYVHEDQFRQEK